MSNIDNDMKSFKIVKLENFHLFHIGWDLICEKGWVSEDHLDIVTSRIEEHLDDNDYIVEN